ncbi:MAG: apolipoprotein N-acyltransferase [Brevinematales bacterium]|nr:apolipoprotein N-acyltransferase [Brevinematales bacterium]
MEKITLRGGASNKTKINIFLAILLSILPSFCFALAFPPFHFPYLIWLGFAPIFFVLKNESYFKSALFVLLSGLLYYVLTINWVRQFHQLYALPFAALGSVLGSYFPALMLSKPVIEKKPIAAFFIIPSIWVIFEYLKTQGFLGFAFGIVGYSLYDFKAFIQIAEVTGVFGISFIVIAFNYLVFYLVDRLVLEKEKFLSPQIIIPSSLVIAVIVGVLVFGIIRLNEKSVPSDFEIGLVQTNIPSELNWDVDQNLIWGECENLLGLVREFHPALIVFPENTVKSDITKNSQIIGSEITNILARLSNYAVLMNASLLIGGSEVDVASGSIVEYNSACLFSPDGKFTDSYQKNRLVPFGESFPYGDIFPYIPGILRETGTHMFTPGNDPGKTLAFTYNGKPHRFGALICFEGTFGYLTRIAVKNGAEFMVNITCDSWANSEAAMEQHALFGIFRAIENRVPFLRAGNGGLTCLIDPWGRILNSLNLMESSAAVTKIPFVQDKYQTIYILFGDWPVVFSGLFLGGWIIYLITIYIIKKGREKPAPKE